MLVHGIVLRFKVAEALTARCRTGSVSEQIRYLSDSMFTASMCRQAILLRSSSEQCSKQTSAQKLLWVH